MQPESTPDFAATSVARVITDKPARYGKQLANHMSRKIPTTWDEPSATGSLTFNLQGPVTGVVDLACEAGALVLTLHTSASEQQKLEQVTGMHLARFGHKDALTVTWQREHGAAGSTQGPFSSEDMARMSRERAARKAANTTANND